MCLSNGQYGPHEEGDDPVEHYRLLIRCMMEYFPTRFPTGLKWVQPHFFTEIGLIGGILSYLHAAIRRLRILQPEDHHQNPSGLKRIQDACIH